MFAINVMLQSGLGITGKAASVTMKPTNAFMDSLDMSDQRLLLTELGDAAFAFVRISLESNMHSYVSIVFHTKHLLVTYETFKRTVMQEQRLILKHPHLLLLVFFPVMRVNVGQQRHFAAEEFVAELADNFPIAVVYVLPMFLELRDRIGLEIAFATHVWK